MESPCRQLLFSLWNKASHRLNERVARLLLAPRCSLLVVAYLVREWRCQTEQQARRQAGQERDEDGRKRTVKACWLTRLLLAEAGAEQQLPPESALYRNRSQPRSRLPRTRFRFTKTAQSIESRVCCLVLRKR